MPNYRAIVTILDNQRVEKYRLEVELEDDSHIFLSLDQQYAIREQLEGQ